ncbi:MAG: hypothetical protein Q9163_002386 [Psora crenata]
MQAVTDLPAVAFAPELIAAYPEAKVILTNRDVDAWFESFNAAILKNMSSSPMNVLFHYMSKFFLPSAYDLHACIARILTIPFDGDFKKHGKRSFHEHYARVRALVPKEKLLEYRVNEGWEPLCRFLDVPVPDEPFPSVNDRAETTKRLRVYSLKERIAILEKAGYWFFGLALLLFAIWIGQGYIS